MRTPPDYRALAPTIGVDPAAIPTIIGSAARSWARLGEARRCLSELDADAPEGVALFALGSLGRLEASEASDLDLAAIYRGDAATAAAADQRRSEAATRLRALGFEVADKTFARALDLDALVADVGGRQDTCDHLTYRALLLTEGAWVHAPAVARGILDAIFQAYTRGTIASGRFLSALGNDLHRYYRTICVDYRHKVEVAGKGWALRNLKLRHSRKTWHLANLVLFTWASEVDEDAREGLIAAHLSEPPLARIAAGLDALGAAPLAGPLFVAYERFLAALADPEARASLDALDHEARTESALYRDLRGNADRLDDAAQAIALHLLENHQRYMIRFGLL
ncbi:MAG: hypothetical protein KC486_30540 [Myxococcales bacterium]|nr:hypothetical protein [Myxococcales bacterium]